jgi:recombinational DNA repair ATPase RecF
MGYCLIALVGHIKRRRFWDLYSHIPADQKVLAWVVRVQHVGYCRNRLREERKIYVKPSEYSRNHAWLRVVDQQFAKSGDEVGISTK